MKSRQSSAVRRALFWGGWSFLLAAGIAVLRGGMPVVDFVMFALVMTAVGVGGTFLGDWVTNPDRHGKR